MLRLSPVRGVLVTVAVIVVGVLMVVLAATARPADEPAPRLVNVFDDSPTGFRFRYPDGWQYTIPRNNLLILAQPATLAGEPGPLLTVQRSAPLTAEGSLSDALDTYLRRGPLRPDREWSVITEPEAIIFNGRDALTTDLEGKDVAEGPTLHTHIVATRADNGLVYLFTATAPAAEWQPYQPLLESILNSVEILE